MQQLTSGNLQQLGWNHRLSQQLRKTVATIALSKYLNTRPTYANILFQTFLPGELPLSWVLIIKIYFNIGIVHGFLSSGKFGLTQWPQVH